MKACPYCGYSNYEPATECRHCQSSLLPQQPVTVCRPKEYFVGPKLAKSIRNKALAVVVVGLFMKVYWGGYGPWPVIDYPPFASVRPWLEHVLIFGGVVAYLAGWFLRFI
jgi:hypothetical protein